MECEVISCQGWLGPHALPCLPSALLGTSSSIRLGARARWGCEKGDGCPNTVEESLSGVGGLNTADSDFLEKSRVGSR